MAVRALPLPPPVFLLALLLALVASVAHGGDGKLRVGFYKDSCPDAEAIVRRIVARAVREDPTANAPLLRLHFHDCFVRVCRYCRMVSFFLNAEPCLCLLRLVLLVREGSF